MNSQVLSSQTIELERDLCRVFGDAGVLAKD